MKSAKLIICVVSAMFAVISPARTQALLAGDVPVRVENFVRAESDLFLSTVGLGRGHDCRHSNHCGETLMNRIIFLVAVILFATLLILHWH
jgi:hypothetical protein